MKNLLTLLRPTSPEQQALKDVQNKVKNYPAKSGLWLSHSIFPVYVTGQAPTVRIVNHKK
jgi:hypothetical protein